MDSGGFDYGGFGRGLDLVGAGLAAVAGESAAAASNTQLRAALVQCQRYRDALEAHRLRLIAALDSHPDAVPGAKPGTVAATFLVHRLNVSSRQAASDVKAAHALNPAPTTSTVKRLPRLGAALAAGEISREHVDVGVRVLQRLPSQVLKVVDADGVSGMEKVDGWLAETSRAVPPATTDQAAQHLLDVVAPDHADRFDPASLERRELFTGVDSTGMLVLRGQLDPLTGATVRRALEHFSRPDPARHEPARSGDAEGGGGQELLAIRDTRTAAQRRADALGTICDLALDRPGADPDDTDADVPRAIPDGPGGGPGDGGPGESESRRKDGAVPRLVVHTTPDLLHEALHTHPGGSQHGAAGPGSASRRPTAPLLGVSECDQIGPVGPGLLGVWACDALIERVLLAPNGALLDLGRTIRTITPPQRRALTARDRGCVIPACTAPADRCHGHHVRWWEDSGVTDKNNLALVCGRHHAQLHAGTWDLRMIDGSPWARPPRWIDPQRRWVRNTHHHTKSRAARLGTQLRLPGLTRPDGSVDHHGDDP